MLGMASPTGYLDLTLPSISGATPDGTGTVDGVAVTDYDVTVDPSQLATSPATTPEEATTIDNAVAVLDQQGYTGTTVVVGIDASGFIRQAVWTTRFTDGGTSVLTATFSDFGCAGSVLMPGQTGSTAPCHRLCQPRHGHPSDLHHDLHHDDLERPGPEQRPCAHDDHHDDGAHHHHHHHHDHDDVAGQHAHDAGAHHHDHGRADQHDQLVGIGRAIPIWRFRG